MTLLSHCVLQYLRLMVMPEAHKLTSTTKAARQVRLLWCWVKRAESLGLEPAPHITKKLSLSGDTNGEHRKPIFSIFVDLSSDSLLRGCLKKRNQNPNESFHSKLWKICMKHKDCSIEHVAFAAGTVVLKHNFGCVEVSLMARLGLLSAEVLERSQDEDSQKAVATPTKRKRESDGDPSAANVPGGF